MKNTLFISYVLLLILHDVHLQDNPTERIDESTTTESTSNISEEKSSLDIYYRCLPSLRVKVITRCPAEYKDKIVIRKCEKGLFPLDDEDISITVPVTGRGSGIHYANQYCALCHNDSSNEQWELDISWPSNFFSGSDQNLKKDEKTLSTLHYDERLKRYMVNVTADKSALCTFRPVQPENVTLMDCSPQIIWECPSVYEGAKDCNQFGGYIVCDWPNYAFVNAECARCNNFTLPSTNECNFMVMRSSPVKTLFQLKKSSGNACSIPAIAKYYC